jgi:acetyltransferase-like isoleucine patch superfamily enzyme
MIRESAKTAARGFAALVVFPALVSFRLRAAIVGRDRALEGSTQALSLLPGLLGQYLRRAFLCRVLRGCHSSATIEFGTIFSKAGAIIDENAYIGPHCHIGLAHIEANVLLAGGVHVPSGARTHGTADTSQPIREQPGMRILVRIGRGSWIGSAAVVMADVGRECVIGAGAVVTRALPDGVVAAGVPARVVRVREARGSNPSDRPDDARTGISSTSSQVARRMRG